MTMPTRRAVRPDSKHYRDSRRQRMARSMRRAGGRGLWIGLAAIFMVGLIVAGMTMLASHQPHIWTHATLYVSIAGTVISMAAAALSSR